MFIEKIFLVAFLIFLAMPSRIYADNSRSTDPTGSSSNVAQYRAVESKKCMKYEFSYKGTEANKPRVELPLRNDVYEVLYKAQDELAVGNWDRARVILDEMMERKKLNSYEEAMFRNLYAYIHCRRSILPRPFDLTRRLSL